MRLDFVDQTWETFNMPMWLTEFAMTDRNRTRFRWICQATHYNCCISQVLNHVISYKYTHGILILNQNIVLVGLYLMMINVKH
jgi:hypothetical protein